MVATTVDEKRYWSNESGANQERKGRILVKYWSNDAGANRQREGGGRQERPQHPNARMHTLAHTLTNKHRHTDT